jgi:hypothetical protein
MAFGGPNPGIWGDSVRKALNPGGEQDAHEHMTSDEQALLDAEELREVERSERYGEAPQAGAIALAPRPTRLRSIVARIFRRSA